MHVFRSQNLGTATRSKSASTSVLVDRSVALARLDEAQGSARTVGVVHLDIDRFHQVNTHWGHVVGDRVLAMLGPRLTACAPKEAVIAATGGDAFVAVIPGADRVLTTAIAEQLLTAAAEPFVIGGNGSTDGRLTSTVSLRASAGIAWTAEHDRPSDLLEHAFLACRQAKATAPGTVVAFEYSLGHEATRRLRIEEELRRAIVNDELRLFVQPEIDLRDGRVVGVEALVRWQHPTEGLLAPASFLPDAEAAGLMIELGDWVLDAAIDLANRWRGVRDGEPMRVWVNLAAQQLADGAHLNRQLVDALSKGRITSRCIGFEVTESTVLEDIPAATRALLSLRELGFEIALDDFGTGYSSLSHLRQLPVTAVKIDRSFVAGIGDSLSDEAIVEAVIDLSHALGLRVIAEGIEDVQQAASLVRMGADHAQGYHFGRPLPPNDMLESLSVLWCGAEPPSNHPDPLVHRADELPGFGSPRARLLMAALDSAHDAVLVTAATGGDEISPPIVYVNAAFETETGLRSREVVGRTVAMLLPDEVVPEVLTWFAERRESGTAGSREIPSRNVDGTTSLCEATVSPIFDERGVHTHWMHVRRDLTKRRAAENERRRFQGLIEQTTSLVFIAERGGQLVYANAAQRRALGLGLDDPLDGITTTTTFSDMQQEQIETDVLPALRSKRAWQGESVFEHRETGERTDVLADVQYVDDPLRPGVRFFACVSRDITEEKRNALADRRRREIAGFAARVAESALEQDLEQFFDGLDQVLRDLGVLLDADLSFVHSIDFDRGTLRPIGGWTSGRYPDQGELRTEVPLDRLASWIDVLRQAGGVTHAWRMDDAPWSRELQEVFPGSRGGAAMVTPLRVRGVLLGLVGIADLDLDRRWKPDEIDMLQQVGDTFANLLERQRNGVALMASETRLGAMLASVRDLLLVIDRDGWIRYANQSVETVLGRPAAEMVDQHFLGLVHSDDRDVAISAFMAQLAGEQSDLVEVRVLRADGTAVWFDVDSSTVDDPVVGGFMISLRDVSQRRESAEQDARRAEFERVVLELSQWALEVEPDQVFEGLHGHLERLGRTLQTDAAFAALLDDAHIRNVAGWSVASSSAGYELPPADRELPALVARYRSLEPLIVDDIDDHVGDWVDEWKSFPVPDRAGLNVPLVSGGRCLGNVGVSMASAARVWRADEVALVRRVADTVSALIAREQAEASLRRSEARLSALLDGSHDVVVVVDDLGFIRFANNAVRRDLGYEPCDMVGHRVAEFVHGADLDLATARLASLVDDRPTPITTVRLRAADGSVGWWEITSGDLRDPVAGGRVLACRNVTVRIEDESKGARWVELLRYAFDVAQHALDVDPSTFVDQLPDVVARIAALLEVDLVYIDRLDESRRVLVHLDGWVRDESRRILVRGDTVPFSDIPSWLDLLRRFEPLQIDDAADENETWAVEKRRVMGSEAGLLVVPMSSAGELVGALGVSMTTNARAWTADEVTFLRIVAETVAHVLERLRLDQALRVSEARFRLLSETAADLVILVGADGMFKYVSPSSVAVTGISPSELVGTPAEELIHPDDRVSARSSVPRIIEHGWGMSEMRIRRHDGTWIWVVNSTSVVRDPETGEVVEFRASLRDITERKRLESELQHQALHDPLTGLGNRILLQQRLEMAVAHDDRFGHVSVLLLDLDGFKHVNDTHGHALGDEVLRVVSSRLCRLTRPNDTIARTGGDEFVLLCPGTDEGAAVRIAQRIVDAIRSPLSVGEVTVQLGVSVGIAHHNGELADADSLLIEADRAMFVAKRSGRSRVGLSDRVIF